MSDTNTEALEALAARVERLPAKDVADWTVAARDVNEAVLLAVGWRQDGRDIIDPSGKVRLQAPPVLASLDAAMTLVPEGWAIDLRTFNTAPGAIAMIHPGERPTETCRAATPALALCAAALKARSSLRTDGESAIEGGSE